MKLHRTTGKPDWVDVRKRARNVWQRMAAATKGVATPGNVVTIVGFAIVLLGLGAVLAHEYRAGAILLVVGRMSDVLDGWLADKTATKSPLGELLDAGVDKLGTFLTVLVFFIAGVAPRPFLVALVLPHIVIAGIVFAANRQNKRMHPSRLGKLSMAAAWVSLVGFVAARGGNVSASSVFSISIDVLAGVSVLAGTATALGYIGNYRNGKEA